MATDREFGGGACEKYEPLLEDYLSGELSAEDARSAGEHWQKCAGCSAALEGAARSVRLFRAAEASADPGPGFARTVMARIRAAESERIAGRASVWPLFVSLGWRFAASASLVVALLVTYSAGWGHRLQPKADAPRLTRSTDLFAPEPARVPANGDEVLMMVADTGYGRK